MLRRPLNNANDETIDILGWVEEYSPDVEVFADLDVLSGLLDELTMKYKDRKHKVKPALSGHWWAS